MSLKKCNKCGDLYPEKKSSNERGLCPKCFQEERKRFVKVRDYLWSNPGADLMELHEKTGVSKKLIQKFIREGRFKQR
ncbi:MAG: hypothetical protein R6V17_07270 [Halanaerobacter sp.]